MQHCLRRFCINIGLRLDNKSTTGWWSISYQKWLQIWNGNENPGCKETQPERALIQFVFKIYSMFLSVFELWSVGTSKYVGLVFVFETGNPSSQDV